MLGTYPLIRTTSCRIYGTLKKSLRYNNVAQCGTEAVGIKYFHIPDLGIESDKRSSLTTVEDYQCLFSNYEETLPNLSPLLQQAYSLLRADVRIALMCYERKPEMCHQHVISDYIANTHTVRSTDL